MKSDEKIIILNMLNEGKITVEESIKLIEACANNNVVDDLIDKLKCVCETAKEKAEPVIEDTKDVAKKVYQKAEPKIKEVTKKTKDVAKKVVDKCKSKDR